MPRILQKDVGARFGLINHHVIRQRLPVIPKVEAVFGVTWGGIPEFFWPVVEVFATICLSICIRLICAIPHGAMAGAKLDLLCTE